MAEGERRPPSARPGAGGVGVVGQLVAALDDGDPARVAELLSRHWLDLLAAAPLALLERALEQRPASAAGDGAELLARVVEWISGDREEAARHLTALAATPGGAGAVARLVLAVLDRELPPGRGSSALERLLEAEGQAAGPLWSVRLLGAPQVVRVAGGERREVSWKLRRAFALFAYLASSPDLRAGRDELMEAGWPDAEEATVERNFHPTLSHLRRSLAALAEPGDPPVLLHGQGVYRLNRRYRWQIDTVELAALAARGRALSEAGDAAGAAAAWQAAWSLYKGPFLDGYYSPWVEERREALSLLYQDVLRRLGDLYDDSGRHQQALDAYRAVLAADPLEERVHRAIMRLYARQGRRDLTRLQYDRLTSLLRRELGVEPLPETTSEYHRLMG